MTEAEWLTTPDPERLSLYLAETASDRKLRLLAGACCRHLIAWNEQPRVLEALCRVERYADGQLADSTMERWSRHMWRAMVGRRSAQDIICWALSVACLPRRSPGFVNDWQAMVRIGEGFSAELLRGLPALARTILHEILGNPFRRVTPDAAWLTPSVTLLAQAAYDERSLPAGILDPDRLAVLADALEDAGCTDNTILGHLRGPGPHVRGCHVIDALLGKS
jgi:hypothetical protein